MDRSTNTFNEVGNTIAELETLQTIEEVAIKSETLYVFKTSFLSLEDLKVLKAMFAKYGWQELAGK
jgi:hypothetical protein